MKYVLDRNGHYETFSSIAEIDEDRKQYPGVNGEVYTENGHLVDVGLRRVIENSSIWTLELVNEVYEVYEREVAGKQILEKVLTAMDRVITEKQVNCGIILREGESILFDTSWMDKKRLMEELEIEFRKE